MNLDNASKKFFSQNLSPLGINFILLPMVQCRKYISICLFLFIETLHLTKKKKKHLGLHLSKAVQSDVVMTTVFSPMKSYPIIKITQLPLIFSMIIHSAKIIKFAFLTSYTFDILCLVNSHFCTKKYCLKFVREPLRAFKIFFLLKLE